MWISCVGESVTPLVRWIRNAFQKFIDRYYEGAVPPSRFGELAAHFANQHPEATRLDWVQFSAEHARRAYKEGFLRGMEYTERDPEERRLLRTANPEELADAIDPDWRSSDPVTLLEPHTTVREFVKTPREEIEELLKKVQGL